MKIIKAEGYSYVVSDRVQFSQSSDYLRISFEKGQDNCAIVYCMDMSRLEDELIRFLTKPEHSFSELAYIDPSIYSYFDITARAKEIDLEIKKRIHDNSRS